MRIQLENFNIIKARLIFSPQKHGVWGLCSLDNVYFPSSGTVQIQFIKLQFKHLKGHFAVN